MPISLAQAYARWQELAADIPKDDGPALAESWNDYTDSLCKDGELLPLQYHYAPAYDEQMPGEGSRFDPMSDDREFILAAMGVTLDAIFVPFSQSRNKGEKNLSLNWRVTLKYGTRDVITEDYMQGCAHAPAYNDPQYGRPQFMSIARNAALRRECETGKRADNARSIDPPGVADVLHSLLLDAYAIDCGGFSEWCAEFGFDDDSIKARKAYDACIETAVKLRAAFGDSTLTELRELFQGM